MKEKQKSAVKSTLLKPGTNGIGSPIIFYGLEVLASCECGPATHLRADCGLEPLELPGRLTNVARSTAHRVYGALRLRAQRRLCFRTGWITSVTDRTG